MNKEKMEKKRRNGNLQKQDGKVGKLSMIESAGVLTLSMVMMIPLDVLMVQIVSILPIFTYC
jgi:hypothetical protein